MSVRVLAKKIPTSKIGVFYKQVVNENNKEVDRVYLIRYKDESKRDKLFVIGKKSEKVTIEYCSRIRMEIITKIKFGEDAEILKNKRSKRVINTLDKIANIYFEDKEVNKQQIAKYRNHIQPFFGKKDISLITKDELLSFQKGLLRGTLKYPKRDITNLRTGKKSEQTVNGIIELLKTIFNHNINEKSLNMINPCNGIRKLSVDNKRERFLKSDEIKQLLEEIKENEPLTLFVKLSLQTGGRLETILNIKKKDIDLENRSITLKNLKTNTTYKGFLQNDLIKYLREYLQVLKLNDYVININNPSIKTTSRQIQSRLRKRLDKLFNLELEKDDRKNRVVIHTLRHTFASHLAINGTPIFTIKELMNHKDIEQTMRYAKLSPDSGKEFVENLYLT